MARPHLYKKLKTQIISWAWWCVPVIPATREAEAGELPEPRRPRLRWAEIAPLHSSLGHESETPSQKKKKRATGSLLFYCVSGTRMSNPYGYIVEHGQQDSRSHQFTFYNQWYHFLHAYIHTHRISLFQKLLASYLILRKYNVLNSKFRNLLRFLIMLLL